MKYPLRQWTGPEKDLDLTVEVWRLFALRCGGGGCWWSAQCGVL